LLKEIKISLFGLIVHVNLGLKWLMLQSLNKGTIYVQKNPGGNWDIAGTATKNR
jgi:hypothetical protein